MNHLVQSLLRRTFVLMLHTADIAVSRNMNRPQAKQAHQPPPRSHARRCCALCRQRKTRCELPTAAQELPAGPDPLPPHHSCHRCIVLSMQCILLPVQVRRVKKDSRSAIPSVTSSVGDQKLAEAPFDGFPRIALADRSRKSSTPAPLVHHDLDILTTFRMPEDTNPSGPTSKRENSMIYHGRPLELTVAMLSMNCNEPIRDIEGFGPAIKWDQALLHQLEPGRLQLLSLVPYILPLETLYIRYTRERSTPDALLLYITAYLSALVLSPDVAIAQLLDDLAAGVDTYCALLFLSQTPAVAAVQAFDLLANFAPFGVLPGRPTSPQKILVARGHIFNARYLARSIGLDANTSGDIWTWLSVCATSSSYKLEDWACCDCPEIFEARMLSDAMVGTMIVYDEPQYLAQSMLCEKIARLAIVFEAMASFKHALLGFIDNNFFDAESAIIGALMTATQSFKVTSERFMHLNDLVDDSETSQVSATPLIVRRLFEEGKIQRSATITFIAVALARDPLVNLVDDYQVLTCTPEELRQNQYDSAMSLASNPSNIVQWFSRNHDSPACGTINTWARNRIDGIEEMFVAFGELDSSGDQTLAPWHHIASFLVEASNVLLDLQAAHLVNTDLVHSRRQAHRMSRRAYMMKQVSRTMRSMERGLSNTISVRCSDLIGSMARVYENRTARLQLSPGTSGFGLQDLPPMLGSDYDAFKSLCEFLNEPV